MKKIMAITLFLCVFFIGCEEEPEDKSIGQIIITGIPAKIPVYDNESVENETYRVYLNASNSQDPDKPSAAKGLAEVTPAMKQPNGTYTVTIQLQNPNPDPNYASGSWSGTANYFSIVISPKDVTTDKENAIWAKASINPLDKGMANCDWNSIPMDFRVLLKSDPEDKLKINEKLMAMYNNIVCKDSTITIPQ